MLSKKALKYNSINSIFRLIRLIRIEFDFLYSELPYETRTVLFMDSSLLGGEY